MSLNFFEESGAEVTFPGDDDMVRVPRERLKRLEFCIGVAVGTEKVPSIFGAAASGMISSLITDAPTARAAIEHASRSRG